MKTFRSISRITKLTTTLTIVIFVLIRCIDEKGDDSSKSDFKPRYTFTDFAGSDKCASCHKDVYEKHIKTNHFLTSQPAKEHAIKGSFEPGKNIYNYNPELHVAMEKKDTALYQVIYYKGEQKKLMPFGIITGSGAKGQTYLYWQRKKLFQMPITYFTVADRWANSPGFPDKVQYDRPITSRCLECHTTYAGRASAPDVGHEQFYRNQIIFGVDCEKCHGPAAKHVQYQAEHPTEKAAKFIISPKHFDRQQNLDMCTVCHGGQFKKSKPSFEFTSGDKLSDYFTLTQEDENPDVNNIDVHGNQMGLLKASACFKKSEIMTCNTCHDPHANERGNIAIFNNKCISCHSSSHDKICKMKSSLGNAINTSCINCHMPKLPSKAIALQVEGSPMPKASLIRSHYIAIYPEETRKVMTGMKKLK